MNSFFRKFNFAFLCLAFVCYFTINASAQLSGIYIIGSGGDFATIQEACDSLMSQGVTGDSVHFYILPGTYHEQIQLSQFPIPDDTTIVEFASSSGNAEDVVIYYEPPDVSNSTVFHLDGADNLLFKNLSFHSLGQYYSRDFMIEGDVQNLHFENCIFKGVYNANNDSRRSLILFYNSYTENLIIKNCQFSEGAHGIESNNADYNDVIIESCRFTRIGYEGISLSYSYHSLITKNIIRDAFTGIDMFESYGQDTIAYNDIFTHYQGIDYLGYIEGGADNLIMNNIIRTKNALTGTNAGGLINIRRAESMDIYHNTLLNYSNINGSRNINISSNTVSGWGLGIRIINNLVINYYKGYTLFVTHPQSIAECHHNVFYSAGPVFAYWGDYIFTFEELQSVSGMNYNSMFGLPFLRTDTSLTPVSSFIDNKGTPLSPEWPDFYGNTRDNQIPDIGAVEFNSPGTPPLSGTYSIGQGGDYPSLSSALQDALLRGENGDVSFAFLDGSYTIQDTLLPIPRTNALITTEITSFSQDSSLVTLQPINKGSSSYDYVFIALGSSPYRINRLSFNMSDSHDGAIKADGYIKEFYFTNNYVDHTGFPIQSAIDDGILLSNCYYEYIKIADNYFGNAGRMIISNHSGNTFYPQKLEIVNNEFHVGYSPLYISYVDTLNFENNLSISSIYGPDMNSIRDKLVMKNNIVGTLNGNAVKISNSSFHPYDTSLVFNNFFSKMNPSNLSNEVVEIYNCDYLWFTNNNIKGFQTSSSSGLLRLYNANHLHLLNNLIINDSTGYALYTTGNNILDDIDYNNYYTHGSALASWEGTVCENLDSLRNLTGMDTHSLSVPVTFTSSYDLHINEPALDNKGTPLPFVKKDIDGDYRHPLYPDLGADEFTPFPTNPPYVVMPLPDINIQEDQQNVTLISNLFSYFADSDSGDILTFTVTSDNENVSFRLVPFGNNTLSLLCTPAPDFYGQVMVTVRCTDITNLSVADSFLLTIENIPDNPIAHDDVYEFSITDTVILAVLDNDYDPDNEPVKIISVTQPVTGRVEIGPDSTNVIFYFESTEDSAEFTYTISDPTNLTAQAYVKIRITPLFLEQEIFFMPLENGSISWVDIDNDQDLDLFLAGMKDYQYNQIHSIIYYNDAGSIYNFVRTQELPPVAPGKQASACWGDYNGDGWIDLLISGISGDTLGNFTTVLLKNNFGTFEKEDTPFEAAYNGSNLFFDYDNDGDLDVLISGQIDIGATAGIVKIYRNDGPDPSGGWIFTPVTDFLNYSLVETEAVAADFDNNGYTDLVISGRRDFQNFTTLYLHFPLNQWDTMVLPPLFNAHFNVMDYDADGDLDILYGGVNLYNEDRLESGIWKNLLRETGTIQFQNIDTLFQEKGGSVVWCDFDLDSDVDAIVFGRNPVTLQEYGQYYLNNNGNFIPIGSKFPGAFDHTSIAIGDFDLDLKPDIALMCDTTTIGDQYKSLVKIYKNMTPKSGYYFPKPATFLPPTISETSAEFSWTVDNPPNTGTPPVKNVTFNVGVSTAPMHNFITPPHADASSGYRQIVAIGNTGKRASFKIDNLVSGKQYFAYVQSINQAFQNSAFRPFYFTTINPRFMEFYIPDVTSAPLAVTSADLTGDGQSEIYLTNRYSTERNNLILTRSGLTSMDTLTSDIPSRYLVKSCFLDLDGDSDLDLIDCDLLFYDTWGYPLSLIMYKNENNEFTKEYELPLSRFVRDMIPADMNQDGQEDILLAEDKNITLYIRNGFSLSNVETIYIGREPVSFDVGDINSDGMLDIALISKNFTIMQNNHGVFQRYVFPTPPLYEPKIKILEKDASDNVRIILTSQRTDGAYLYPKCYIYTLTIPTYGIVSLDSIILPQSPQNIHAADINNDGLTDFYLDLKSNGQNASIALFTNTGNGFEQTNTYFPSLINSVSTFIKNQFGALDLFMAGYNYNPYGCIMRNMMVSSTTPPSPPTNLTSVITDSSIIFQWLPSPDDFSEGSRLSYNLRIGTYPGGADIKAPNADSSGNYNLLIPGNVGYTTRWELKNIPENSNIYWSVQAIDNQYNGSSFANEEIVILTDIQEESHNIPKKFALYQNYPNPFNPVTEIKFDVPKPSHVTIKIYNAIGQLVTTLVDEEMKPGYHKIKWDATRYPSGVYFYRMTAENFVDNKKMILIK